MPPISGGACDDIPQCGCQDNQNCDVIDSSGTTTCDFFDTVHTQCFGPAGFGTGPNGCTQDNPFLCAPGYVCLSDNSCTKWCRIGHADCSGAQTCMDLGDSLGGVDFGYCD
jgi:hypothetical protein